MLDSKAVASIKRDLNDKFVLFIRANYVENLALWSFRRHLKTFDTERAAQLEYTKLYPQGTLIPFDDLPKP